MKKWIGVLVLSMVLSKTVTGSDGVQFLRMTPTSAAQKALDEGKLYLFNFSASWCSPCRWMDETTYADPTLAAYMNKAVVAVKVDIDDLDGYALKQRFNVKVLPTILLFNSEGKQLERIEETLAPSRLKAIIQKHDTPNNRVRNKPLSDVFAPDPIEHETVKPMEEVAPPVIHRPALSRPALTPSPLRPSIPEDMELVESRPVTPSPNPPSPFAAGEGLFRVSVDYQPSEGFSLQTGVYADYANVLREVNKLQKQYDLPILINISKRGENILYKVLIGVFNERTQANALKVSLREAGRDTFVKDLSLLK